MKNVRGNKSFVLNEVSTITLESLFDPALSAGYLAIPHNVPNAKDYLISSEMAEILCFQVYFINFSIYRISIVRSREKKIVFRLQPPPPPG